MTGICLQTFGDAMPVNMDTAFVLVVSPSNDFVDCLIRLVVTSATAEQEVLGSISRSGKVLLGFFVRNFSVIVTGV